MDFLFVFTEDFLTENMIHTDIFSYSRLYNYHLYQPDIQPNETLESVFNPIVHEINIEYNFADTYAKEEMLRTLLKLLLLKAERIKQTITSKEKNSEWVSRFSEFRHLSPAQFKKTLTK